jgi:hypothetical protein
MMLRRRKIAGSSGKNKDEIYGGDMMLRRRKIAHEID